MTEHRAKRKLTAILSADVKGYSRLMGEDELSTVQTLKEYREVISNLVQRYSGRVVDSPGDNILAEFGSVVDALECAVKIQEDLKERNASFADNRRMEFRIGVNLGDVIADEGRIYGDGVNVAARVEGLAEGGGICISGIAFDSVRNKLNLGYEWLGEHQVKNISEPIRVYKVLTEPEAAGRVIGEDRPRPKRWRFATVGVALIVVLASLAVWNFYFRAPSIEPVSEKDMAFPLPDKPSIAVLPFANIGDSEQEYIADGITEQIIAALARDSRLFVIARNSTFTYKGKPVMVQQVSRELGVRYVVEGSAQRSGDRIRITAQLIDAIKGEHMWAENYDRDLKDIFALQDEITLRILRATMGKLFGLESDLSPQKGTTNVEAFLKYLKARTLVARNESNNRLAREMCEGSIALDPEFAAAYAVLGMSYWMDFFNGWSKSPGKDLKKASELAQKAIDMDKALSFPHFILGWIYLNQGKHDEAIDEGKKAVALEPSVAMNQYTLGVFLAWADQPEEAILVLKHASRLNPFPTDWQLVYSGIAYMIAERFEEALVYFKKAQERNPDNLMVYHYQASIYGRLGHEEEARAAAKELLRINPKFSVEFWAKWPGCKNRDKLNEIISGLRKAGLPETSPLPLPDKPSIAVLPFVNMSDDKSQEYFSDGLTEEIITALSKTPKLFVIARNSTFVYKGKPVNVQQVSRELGVKYVLEGSVRRSGDQLRMTAQLIDATTGNHLWAERYDREMKDIFAIQDEITLKIISALQVKLTEGDLASILAKGTGSLEAYLKLLEARDLIAALNRDDNALARKKCEEAIALDPKSAVAYAYLGFTYAMDFAFGIDREESMKKAFASTQKSLSLDDSQPAVYTTMEFMYGFMKRHEEAIASGEKAVRIAPGSAYAQFSLGRALNFACRDKEALIHLEMAVRMNPISPATYLMHIGSAHLNLRNYEEAVSALRKALAMTPRNEFARGCLMVAYVEMGRMEEARAEVQEYLKFNPNPAPPEEYAKRAPWKDPKVTERFVAAYRKLRS